MEFYEKDRQKIDYANLKTEYSECQLRVMKYQKTGKQEDIDMILRRISEGSAIFLYKGGKYRLHSTCVENFKNYGCNLCSVFVMSLSDNNEEEAIYQADGTSFRSCIGMMLEQVVFNYDYFFENLDDISWE